MGNIFHSRLVRAGCSALLFAFSSVAAFAMSVNLESIEGAPVQVGTAVTWNATLAEGAEGTIWYRYRVRVPGHAEFQTVRDFSPQSWFKWMPPKLAEGSYEIELTARNVDSGEVISALAGYDVLPIATDVPVITPTANELVYVYSAPACQTGSRMMVSFASTDGLRQNTPAADCDGKSMNVYLAGLRAETQYTVQHTVRTGHGAEVKGPVLTLQTGSLSFAPAATTPVQKPARMGRQPVLVQNRLFEYSVATDEDGQVIWYVPETLQFLTRFEPGGYFFALIEDQNADDTGQLLQELDLAGNTVLETNAARINEQLMQRGMNKITSFHHEARRLASNGNIMVLAATERLLTDVQGPGDVDVIGDMILVLNSNMEVVWAWDAFDHLDVTRMAVLDEKCRPSGGGCPVFHLASTANDWLHGNALELTADGNILYSARHQDWLMKIDYEDGTGSGDVLWRLGKDGDFQISGGGENPWFSHQHDANFEQTGGATSRLLVFDNGNTRREDDEQAHSRGQVMDIDENARTATLVLNVDLGAYSLALGSAQKLSNGDYFFLLGWGPNASSQAMEFDSNGNLVSRFEMQTQQYRAFRMHDLYTP